MDTERTNMEEVALAFDLGGTELRGALVAAGGRVLASASLPTMAHAGPDAVIDQMMELAESLQMVCPQVSLAGVGVGAPGPLDPKAGIVIAPPTLSGWQDVHLAEILGTRFGLPVRLENDANAAALGEWRFGAGRGAESLVFVTVSTGIGGGVISEGRVHHGRRGLAAEIGHMTITGEGPPCFCGTVGCFEAVASGTALGRRATAETTSGDGSLLRTIAQDSDVTARHVVEAGRAGDPQALELLKQQANWLGIGFTNLLHLYSPDVLVMGGGLANGFDLLIGDIEATIRTRAMAAYRTVPVLRAVLGDHAGLIGAASLILSEDNAVPLSAAELVHGNAGRP
jgi:glucokinase